MSLSVYLKDPTATYNVNELYWGNITHNLAEMAEKAGIYKALWRPEEIGAKEAGDIIPILKAGLAKLKADPDYYSQFNSPNGWGMYDHFVLFVEEYLEACMKYLKAKIEISR